MLYCFLEILIAFPQSVWFISFFQEVLLKGLYLVFVLLLFFVHLAEFLFDLLIALFFLLDLDFCLRDLLGDFCYQRLHALHFRNDPFLFSGLLHMNLCL